MVKSMFAAVAGLRAHQEKLDAIGNNVANVNTFGYKTSRVTLASSFYQTLTSASNATGTYGGGNPSQIGYGSQVGSIDVSFTTGSPAATGNSMDCMIDGNGFFIVGPKSENGVPVADVGAQGNLNYTRVGILRFDGEGNLVDSNKNLVYGFKCTGQASGDTAATIPTDGSIVPLNYRTILENNGLDTGEDLSSISISADGTISGTSTKGKTLVVGRVAIANVPNPNALEAAAGSYYKAVANTGTVTVGGPGDGVMGQLKTSCLEMANVDLANEFTEMITTQRGFQANTRIITVTDEMLQDLVNLKR